MGKLLQIFCPLHRNMALLGLLLTWWVGGLQSLPCPTQRGQYQCHLCIFNRSLMKLTAGFCKKQNSLSFLYWNKHKNKSHPASDQCSMCLFITRLPDVGEKNLGAESFLTSLTWANCLGNASFRPRPYCPGKYITAPENLLNGLRLLLTSQECHRHRKHVADTWKNYSTLFY